MRGRERRRHELALAKVVASLIGVPPDEVFKRAARVRKRQAIVRDAIAASVVILAGVGAYYAHPPKKQSLVITETAAKCATRLPAGQAAEGSQNALEHCVTAAEGYRKDAPTDPRDGETARLTNQAKPEEAEHPQVEAIQNGGARRSTEQKKRRRASRTPSTPPKPMPTAPDRSAISPSPMKSRVTSLRPRVRSPTRSKPIATASPSLAASQRPSPKMLNGGAVFPSLTTRWAMCSWPRAPSTTL